MNPFPHPSTTYSRYGAGAVPLVYDRATLEVIPPVQPLKRCSTCKADKAPEAFNKNKARPDGLQCICRACHSPMQTGVNLRDPWKAALRNLRRLRDDTVTTAEHMQDLFKVKRCQATGRIVRGYIQKGHGIRPDSRVVHPARSDANGANGGLLLICGSEWLAKREGSPSAALSALIAKACESIDAFNDKRSTV